MVEVAIKTNTHFNIITMATHMNEYIQEIENLVDYKVEVETMGDAPDIIRFYNQYDEENNGVYNLRLKKIILEDKGSISDIKYNSEFDLIEYYNFKGNGKVWINRQGEMIIKNAEIIKVLSFGCYHIEMEEENSDKTFISKNKYIYCSDPDYFTEGSTSFNKFILRKVEEVTPNEAGDLLLVQTQEYNINKIGVFHLKNLTWIHELKEMN